MPKAWLVREEAECRQTVKRQRWEMEESTLQASVGHATICPTL